MGEKLRGKIIGRIPALSIGETKRFSKSLIESEHMCAISARYLAARSELNADTIPFYDCARTTATSKELGRPAIYGSRYSELLRQLSPGFSAAAPPRFSSSLASRQLADIETALLRLPFLLASRPLISRVESPRDASECLFFHPSLFDVVRSVPSSSSSGKREIVQSKYISLLTPSV